MPPVHPAIVHFPIALLVLSVFGDLFGYIYNSESLKGAGWWSLAGATVGGTSRSYCRGVRRSEPKTDVRPNFLLIRRRACSDRQPALPSHVLRRT